MSWVQINIQVMNEDFRYMKIHIFAPWWRDKITRSSQLRILETCTQDGKTTLLPVNIKSLQFDYIIGHVR